MHRLIPLVIAAVAVCTIAHSPGPSSPPQSLRMKGRLAIPPEQDDPEEYYLPPMLVPQFMGYANSPVLQQPTRNDWLNMEIDRINQMEEEESIVPFEKDLESMIDQDPYLARMFESPKRFLEEPYGLEIPLLSSPTVSPAPIASTFLESDTLKQQEDKKDHSEESVTNARKDFALTPKDKEFFAPVLQQNEDFAKFGAGHHEGGGKPVVPVHRSRQIRQNPNLSKTKTLIAENLERLRIGMPHDDSGSTEKPRSIHSQEPSTADPTDSIYGVAIIAGVASAFALGMFGFAYGWYTLSKRAKAAADIDYPAYGVTGPTVDVSGDRKLAHSAHMYHYQHQKQQIIAMERNGLERNGSVSDPESEEENEEGDYTVYECPGFATTGDMEVRNPMFKDDPTPATPGKCEIVKQQPKE